MGEIFCAGEEVGGYLLDGVGAVGLGFGAFCLGEEVGLGHFGLGQEFGFGGRVESAEGLVIWRLEHAAAAAGGGVVLAERLAIGVVGHRCPFLLGLWVI